MVQLWYCMGNSWELGSSGPIEQIVFAQRKPFAVIYAEYVSKDNPEIRIGAILGLGIAYAGREKEEVAELLLPIVMDTDCTMEVGQGLSLGQHAVQPFCSAHITWCTVHLHLWRVCGLFRSL